MRAARLIVVAVLASGCDPHVDIVGRVISDAGVPVDGLTVSLSCPPKTQVTVGSPPTAADGTFRLEGVGCVRKTCAVVVQRGDRTVGRAKLDGCHDPHRFCGNQDCNQATVRVELK